MNSRLMKIMDSVVLGAFNALAVTVVLAFGFAGLS